MNHCSFEIDQELYPLKTPLSRTLGINRSYTKGWIKNLSEDDSYLDQNLQIQCAYTSSGQEPTIKPIKGLLLMLCSVLGMTFFHLFAKIATFKNPKLNSNDCLLFVGFINLFIFSILAKRDKVNLNPFKFTQKIGTFFVLSLLWALGINNLMLLGVTLIPIGKAVLIFDINPILTMLFAGILLNEKIEKIFIMSTLGSLLGIYLLTLHTESSHTNSNPLYGTIAVLWAAVCQGMVFITVRCLGAAKIHYAFRPWFVGLTLLIYSILIQGGINTYSLEDFIYLSLWGVSWAVWLGFQTAAFSCQLASKLVPMIYIENIFTLLADMLIFGYKFGLTDILGIGIILIFILLPLLKNQII